MFGWSEWFGLHEGNKIEKGAMHSKNEYLAPDVHLLVHRRGGDRGACTQTMSTWHLMFTF